MLVQNYYPLIKLFHLLFVISWFACLFYLPRILVNLAEDLLLGGAARDRLLLMARRLYRFSHIMMGLAIVSGLFFWMVFKFSGGWLHAKIALVCLLICYQVFCGLLIKKFSNKQSVPTAYALRWFNEIPVLFLICILALVLFKPM